MLRFVHFEMKNRLPYALAIVAAFSATGSARPPLVVSPPSYEVIKMADLEFGTLVAGTGMNILHIDPRAARFQVRHLNGPADIRLQFILPAHSAEASADFQLTFGSGSAAWADRDDLAGRTTFDPNEPVHLTIPADGDFYVWIGGKIFLSNAAHEIPNPTTIVLTVSEN